MNFFIQIKPNNYAIDFLANVLNGAIHVLNELFLTDSGYL